MTHLGPGSVLGMGKVDAGLGAQVWRVAALHCWRVLSAATRAAAGQVRWRIPTRRAPGQALCARDTAGTLDLTEMEISHMIWAHVSASFPDFGQATCVCEWHFDASRLCEELICFV